MSKRKKHKTILKKHTYKTSINTPTLKIDQIKIFKNYTLKNKPTITLQQKLSKLKIYKISNPKINKYQKKT